MKRVSVIFRVTTLAFLPIVASAQSNPNFGYFTNIIESFRNWVDLLIPFTIALGVLFFFYGLAKFILNAGDDDARTEGKKIMLWGLVALFVMASLWGILQWIGGIIGVDPGAGTFVPPSVSS